MRSRAECICIQSTSRGLKHSTNLPVGNAVDLWLEDIARNYSRGNRKSLLGRPNISAGLTSWSSSPDFEHHDINTLPI